MKKACPNCGSQEVQEMLLVWSWVNTGEPVEGGEVSLARLYDHPYYCSQCNCNLDHLVETEKGLLDGWEKIGTGGGCTAYIRECETGHIMITDIGGAQAPDTLDTPALVGVYDDYGREVTTVRFRSLQEALDSMRSNHESGHVRKGE